MNVRIPGVSLLRKSFTFCMCFILLGAMTLCARGSTKNHAARHSIQSHAGSLTPQPVTALKGAAFAKAYGNFPARFIENRRQAKGRAAVYGVWFDGADYFIHRRIALSLQKAEGKTGRIRPETTNPKAIPAARRVRKLSEGHASYLRVRLLGIDREVEVAPGDAPPVKLNCFSGDAPGKEPTNIPTCKAVLYRKICPRTDSKSCGDTSQLEYDFIAKPGAAPCRPRLQGSGAKDVRPAGAGELELDSATPGRRVRRDRSLFLQIRWDQACADGGIAPCSTSIPGAYNFYTPDDHPGAVSPDNGNNYPDEKEITWKCPS